jgi:hypothetical protein
MPARGAAPLIMGPAHESASEVSSTPKFFLETPLALTLPYRDWRSPLLDANSNSSVPHVYFDNLQIEGPSPYDNDHDYAKIQTPYSASQFQIFLKRAQLLSRYPELPFKLTHGFPIGNLAPLHHTFAPPNLPGALHHADTIRAYIAEELHLGRFSGPFTREELECKIGPFRSSPLQVATKEGAPGEPAKLRVCRHLSYKGKTQSSINDEINTDDYPTRWGKATDVADIVCLSFSFSLVSCNTSRILAILSNTPALFSFSSHYGHTSVFLTLFLNLAILLSHISHSHNDNNLFLFSILTKEVICGIWAHTHVLFEGHRR